MPERLQGHSADCSIQRTPGPLKIRARAPTHQWNGCAAAGGASVPARIQRSWATLWHCSSQQAPCPLLDKAFRLNTALERRSLVRRISTHAQAHFKATRCGNQKAAGAAPGSEHRALGIFPVREPYFAGTGRLLGVSALCAAGASAQGVTGTTGFRRLIAAISAVGASAICFKPRPRQCCCCCWLLLQPG
jgi:hypothetical protein